MATYSLGNTAKCQTLICENMKVSNQTTLTNLAVTDELTVGSGITLTASSKTVTANVINATTTLRAEKSLEITPGPGLGSYTVPYEFTVDAAIDCATLPSLIEIYGYSLTEDKVSFELQFPFSDAIERVSLFISAQQIQPIQGAVEDCRLVSTMVSPKIGSLGADLLVEVQFSQLVELTQRQKISVMVLYN